MCLALLGIFMVSGVYAAVPCTNANCTTNKVTIRGIVYCQLDPAIDPNNTCGGSPAWKFAIVATNYCQNGWGDPLESGAAVSCFPVECADGAYFSDGGDDCYCGPGYYAGVDTHGVKACLACSTLGEMTPPLTNVPPILPTTQHEGIYPEECNYPAGNLYKNSLGDFTLTDDCYYTP